MSKSDIQNSWSKAHKQFGDVTGRKKSLHILITYERGPPLFAIPAKYADSEISKSSYNMTADVAEKCVLLQKKYAFDKIIQSHTRACF